ncbi:hypothetical protein PILCRDRAFT_14013 [Piloderma croceum F 1598]|uniref:Uncharacterized protein n=1 Tax=Piloderma croceum (strain F 1598) TaxID=765440 RepID=A0A0C3EQT8_PILCF|nr:hypothetical protein PILCRDRAFT_14013 [Piloderma croceum F 1598]
MQDNVSYIEAGAKCSASYVSVATWKQGQKDLTRLHCERDSLRDRLREAEQEVDSLRCEGHNMEAHLHAQNSAPSYAAVTESQLPALAPAKCTTVALKATFILKVSSAPQRVVPPMVSPTPKALKGKATDYEASLAYNDDKYGSNFNPTKNAAEEAKAVDSTTGQLIVAILNGTVPTHTVGPSGSNSVEGRVLDLCRASNAEFQLTLEQAHTERNVHKGNLLLLILQTNPLAHVTSQFTPPTLSTTTHPSSHWVFPPNPQAISTPYQYQAHAPQYSDFRDKPPRLRDLGIHPSHTLNHHTPLIPLGISHPIRQPFLPPANIEPMRLNIWFLGITALLHAIS